MLSSALCLKEFAMILPDFLRMNCGQSSLRLSMPFRRRSGGYQISGKEIQKTAIAVATAIPNPGLVRDESLSGSVSESPDLFSSVFPVGG